MAKSNHQANAPKSIGFTTGQVLAKPGIHSRGTYPEWILSISLEGSTDYYLNEQHHLNAAGDMLLLSRNINQYWQVPGPAPWSVVYTIFEPRTHWLPWLDTILQGKPWRVAGQGTRDFFPAAEVLKQADSLRRSTHIPFAKELALNALERAILMIAQALPQQPGRVAADPRIQQALAWAVNHLDRPITLEDLAHAGNASRANFCRLFKRATSQAPMQYIDHLRMDRAQELLATTGLPVKQVASMVGFDDPKYFAKRFKAILGLPPTAFKPKP